jgi:predicted CopG family antitoxin
MTETKTIALDKEAYELLRKRKGADESFSDVVKRLAGRKRKLADLAGIWKSMSREEIKRIEDAIEKGRELDRERAAGLLKRAG